MRDHPNEAKIALDGTVAVQRDSVLPKPLAIRGLLRSARLPLTGPLCWGWSIDRLPAPVNLPGVA